MDEDYEMPWDKYISPTGREFLDWSNDVLPGGTLFWSFVVLGAAVFVARSYVWLYYHFGDLPQRIRGKHVDELVIWTVNTVMKGIVWLHLGIGVIGAALYVFDLVWGILRALLSLFF